MSGDDAPAVDVVGKGLEAAVDAVVEADGSRDRTLVRDALERVTEDGVVTWDAVDDALPAVTQGASTAEERTSMASFELAKLRDDAEDLSDLPTVEARLAEFESELSVLSDRSSDLRDRVDAVHDRVEAADSLYPVAAEFRDVADEAESIEDTAMALIEAIEDLADDVADPEGWVRNVRRDLVAVEDTLEALETVADNLESAVAGDGDDWAAEIDPAVAWFDATLRVGVVDLMVADAAFELGDLRTWADRADADWYPDDADDQVADLRDRRASLETRLDDLSDPAWRERFGDRLDAFEDDLAGTDPPVDWRELQMTLDRYRPEDATA
jgi:predicted  nucleic acid-binding Zn-ribbon protein